MARFGRCAKSLTSWREANGLACISIRNNFNKPLWVLFSGGTDSEICIRSFRAAKIPIKIATLKFKNNKNQHDLIYVERLRKQLDLDVVYFELDIEDFFESSTLYGIVDPIQCVSPALACTLWLADQLDGVPIISQAEPYLKKEIPKDYIPGVSSYVPSAWHLVESERLCSLYKHFIFQNRPAVPGFFQYLPEQFYTYLKYNPILQELIQNKITGKLGTRTSKNSMAYQFYPEIEPREKFTGHECLQAAHDKKRAELAQRFPHSDKNFYIEYNELLQVLEPDSSEKFPFNERIIS